jgi:solute carrier family 40 (iron-regulated transporter), member 1
MQEVEAEHRGAFSSIEASFQSTFELLSYMITIVFSQPTQFRWPALVSCAAIFLAGGLYSRFVRSRRGHLFHFSTCVDVCDRGHEYDKVILDGFDYHYGGVGQRPYGLYRDIR